MTSTPNEVRQTMAERDHPDRPGHRETRAHASRQTFEYPLRREFVRYMLSKEGQTEVVQSGYLPVTNGIAKKALATVDIK